MPVTEIATIPLSAGSNVRKRGSEANRIWQDMLAIISGQDGCQNIYSGLQYESPNMAQLFIGRFEATRPVIEEDCGPLTIASMGHDRASSTFPKATCVWADATELGKYS